MGASEFAGTETYMSIHTVHVYTHARIYIYIYIYIYILYLYTYIYESLCFSTESVDQGFTVIIDNQLGRRKDVKSLLRIIQVTHRLTRAHIVI